MRTWTLPEANAALPRVRELVAEGRKNLDLLEDADANLHDLSIIWGKRIVEPDCEGHAEFIEYQRRHLEATDEMVALTLKLQALGVEVKDFHQGLVDFRGHLGNDTVYLCWKWGEDAVKHWHTLDSGFAGRKSIPGL